MQIGKGKTHAQLTAPGDGSSLKLQGRHPSNVEGKVTVAVIDTNVVVRYDHSNVSTFATVVKGVEVTITANGSYAIPVRAGYKYVRPVFVSETGGTAATVDFVTTIHK